MTEGTQSLHFSCYHLYEKYKVLQDAVLSALMLGRVLVLAKAVSKRGAFGGVKGGVLFYSPI